MPSRTWRCIPAPAVATRYSMWSIEAIPITVLKRRTDWFRVRTAKGKEGWVKRADMELTLTPDGEQYLLR